MSAPHDAGDDTPLDPALPAAVLWDMDGTLVDTEPYWFAAQRDVVERYGRGRWSTEHNHALVGKDLIDAAEYMCVHAEIDLPPRDVVEHLLDGVIARLHRRIPWRPGARELLAELHQEGVPCALVTMSWRRFVDPILAALPPGTFTAVITGDEIPHGEGKPHPTPYLLGARACGAHPADCVALEDSMTGTTSALAAGCRVVGIPNVVELRPRDGMTIVDSLEDLDLDGLERLMLDDLPGERRPPELRAAGRPLLLLGLLVVTALMVVWVVRDRDADRPPGAIPVDVWAPYWTLGDTVSETGLRFDQIREISPFWFDVVAADLITTAPNTSIDLADRFVDAADKSRGRLVPSLRDAMPAGAMAAILADPATRATHVDTVVAFADSMDVDGIDLDYEQFAFADGASTWEATRPYWVAFIADLAAALHDDGRTLTVSIPPVYDETVTADRGYWVYDHGAIAEHVDAIRIMAYDYSVGEAGPIAPLAWVGDAIAGVSRAVPPELHHKLVLGVPSYGSNWVVSTLGECPASAEGRTNVTARAVIDLATRRDGAPVYEPTLGEWSFAYAREVVDGAERCIQNRKVHWVDAEGVAARVTLAREAGWGGVALWALGYEDDEVWQALVNAATMTDATEP